MRVLVSALSCNPSLGSEALVGFKYAEALSQRFETVVIAAAPGQAPEGATLMTLNVGQCLFNEVSAGPQGNELHREIVEGAVQSERRRFDDHEGRSLSHEARARRSEHEASIGEELRDASEDQRWSVRQPRRETEAGHEEHQRREVDEGRCAAGEE